MSTIIGGAACAGLTGHVPEVVINPRRNYVAQAALCDARTQLDEACMAVRLEARPSPSPRPRRRSCLPPTLLSPCHGCSAMYRSAASALCCNFEDGLPCIAFNAMRFALQR